MSSVPWLAGKSQWEQIHSYFQKPWMRLKNQIRRKLGIWKSWNILGKPWYAIFQEYELYESSAFGLGFSPGTWLTWLDGFTTSKPSAPGIQFESQFDVDSRKETPHLSKNLRFFSFPMGRIHHDWGIHHDGPQNNPKPCVKIDVLTVESVLIWLESVSSKCNASFAALLPGGRGLSH